MAHAATLPTEHELAQHVTPAGDTPVQHPPVSPGKVAMWLFLATEVMFFTGLIGTYIVLRSGSPFGGYSHDYPPGTDLAIVSNLPATKLFKWPKPYDTLVNPLSINLTAVNTFILICSSVTMVLALSAIQRGDKRKTSLFLLATVVIGSIFLSVQVYEYYQLMIGHHYPIGVSASGHFRPSSSLFASCFFTMTGFHGAHVAGGVVMLTCIFVQSLRGVYTREHHSPVELVGLYWHFVDLVWIILFTVVYLL
jgi:heme/copper-type cytochrome/quinol oxidase subunit 3